MSNKRSKGIAVNSNGIKPIALVYRGPAGNCPECSEALATLLESDTLWNFDVMYVGPDGEISVEDGLQLSNAVLYAQPGGNGNLKDAFEQLKEYAPAMRKFVTNGGRFLGTCMGAYMVGNDPESGYPGYDLGLQVGQYIYTGGATVKSEEDSIVQIVWRGKKRYMYIQDGPYFKADRNVNGKTILAYYTNGKVAAMVQPYERGWIGVSGSHPEADADWYKNEDENICLIDPDGFDADLGRDLIDTLMMQI